MPSPSVVSASAYGHGTTNTGASTAVSPGGSTNTVSPFVLNVPTVAVGDRLILWIKPTSGGMIFTTPTGWSDFNPAGLAKPPRNANGSTAAQDVFAWTRTVPSGGLSQISLPYTVTSSAACEALLVVIRDVDATDWYGTVVETQANSTLASPRTLGSVPSLLTGAKVLRLVATVAPSAVSGQTYGFNWPSPLVESGEGSSPATASIAANVVGAALRTMTADGATGTAAVDLVDSTNTPVSWASHRAWAFELKAALAPANTVAPTVTGNAVVGDTLTCSAGTWSPDGTKTYQWQQDGVDITGATASTYVVQSGDAGHALRCVVTATNTAGAASVNSNAISIPAAPVFTVAPAITTDGTPATGETITCDTGTVTGTGVTYTYQWYRGASPITGATTNSYTLQVSDEGANITCHVTATNGGGSATSNSNTIVPAVTAPLSDASGLWYYSGGTGNTDPALSIGGTRGGTIPDATANSIFGPIPGTLAQGGGTLYAIVYVRNTHTTTTDPATRLIVLDQPDNTGLHIDVAVPDETVNTPVAALASNTTPPVGLTFARPSDFAGGLAFGNLPPAGYRGVVVRLTIDPDTAPGDDSFALRVRSETA